MKIEDFFLQLVRLGIGQSPLPAYPESIDWKGITTLAESQGLSAIILDGMERIPVELKPEKKDLLRIIGSVLHSEDVFVTQWKSACELARLYSRNGIRTYVLKGYVISECYPNPKHRPSVDLDCFLTPVQGDGNVWELGNRLVENLGYNVDRSFYKNSAFSLPGLAVENHHFMVPVRGNKTMKSLERVLQSYIYADKGEDVFEGTCLYRPPVLMSALFLIEHSYSHFLHEGLTWRHVLDWMMFRRKHIHEIDWNTFDALIDEFGFRRFYDSYLHLGKYLLGEIEEEALTELDKKMLADVWAPLDLHESMEGLKWRFVMAGNTWRARWKYRYFTLVSMPRALWMQVMGYLFERHPKLD